MKIIKVSGVSNLFRQLMYSGFSFQSIIYVLILAVVVLLALSIHETAHGFAAYSFLDLAGQNLL